MSLKQLRNTELTNSKQTNKKSNTKPQKTIFIARIYYMTILLVSLLFLIPYSQQRQDFQWQATPMFEEQVVLSPHLSNSPSWQVQKLKKEMCAFINEGN